MSLPPETITVKRKRRAEGDDEPVNFLRVEETKRLASGTWLYRRKQPEVPITQQQSTSNNSTDGIPSIQTSRPGDERKVLRSQANAPSAIRLGPSVIAPTVPVPGVASLPSNSNANPRRFHYTQRIPTDTPIRRSKRARNEPAVFVERSPKRTKTAPTATQQETRQGMEQDRVMEERVSRPLKRPGARARTKVNQQATTQASDVKKPELPSSLRNRKQEEDMDALAREMNEYILQQINHDRAKLEAQQRPTTTTTPAKYRPKAPLKRYAERHPEVASPSSGNEDVNMEKNETDDEDYVLETFVRIPAHTVTVPVPAEQVGVLVFDQETDIEYFYGAGDDSSDEYNEDDEDSNAEDYYAADYPEDEVASDDEFGRDDYHYRNGNASDMEEFDGVDEDDDTAKSDDEAVLSSQRLPGAADLWRLEKTMRAKLGLQLPRSRPSGGGGREGSPMAMDD